MSATLNDYVSWYSVALCVPIVLIVALACVDYLKFINCPRRAIIIVLHRVSRRSKCSSQLSLFATLMNILSGYYVEILSLNQ